MVIFKVPVISKITWLFFFILERRGRAFYIILVLPPFQHEDSAIKNDFLIMYVLWLWFWMYSNDLMLPMTIFFLSPHTR